MTHPQTRNAHTHSYLSLFLSNHPPTHSLTHTPTHTSVHNRLRSCPPTHTHFSIQSSSHSTFHFYKRYVDDILIFTSGDHFDYLLHCFSTVHPNLSVSFEKERENQLAFLDVLMERKPDGTLQRKVHRKPTWTGQYLHFSSFCPVAYKRGLVRTLFHRARNICSADQLRAEEDELRRIFRENGYPENFVRKHSGFKMPSEQLTTVSKKQVFLNLRFRGDHLASDTRRKVTAAINRTYPAAQLRLVWSTRRVMLNHVSRNLCIHSTSHVIYQFTCSCGDVYIGRTDRYLSERMTEHMPKWLIKSMARTDTNVNNTRRSPASSIGRHLHETGHVVDPQASFTTVLRNRNRKLLTIYEAMIIRLRNPKLCAQKRMTHIVSLPWI